jgi:predicted short-subunit dehydrogenase-like oxidoreductase (DUF2520 family)
MVTRNISLGIVGCGRAGQALGRLLHEHGVFTIQDIVTASLESATRAAEFVGQGMPCGSVAAMRQADVVLIATPDSVVADIVQQLCSSTVVRKGCVVFHCSGALSSEMLADLREAGASVASVHPVKSFSSAAEAVSTFTGTFCAIEGDEAAVRLLSSAFEAIGARMFSIKADSKVLYHAAFVFACNYLTALMECAFQCCSAAGIERTDAARMIEPLVRETTAAVMSRGVESALTGPVARGDAQVIIEQLSKVGEWRSDYADIYRRLGQVALEIAERGGSVQGSALAQTREALRTRQG